MQGLEFRFIWGVRGLSKYMDRPNPSSLTYLLSPPDPPSMSLVFMVYMKGSGSVKSPKVSEPNLVQGDLRMCYWKQECPTIGRLEGRSLAQGQRFIDKRCAQQGLQNGVNLGLWCYFNEPWTRRRADNVTTEALTMWQNERC